MNLQLDFSKGHFIVDTSPEFDDSTLVKIDFVPDHESERCNCSQSEANMTGYATKHANKVARAKPSSLQSRLEQRLSKSMNRLDSYNWFKPHNVKNAQLAKQREVFEFIKALNHGTGLTCPKPAPERKLIAIKLKLKILKPSKASQSEHCDTPTWFGSDSGNN
uniref:Uncharacterized protein n=1 Tax=Euplotes harpa TaxID=151035 RepID=A0A7S3JMS3_9SPIT|mmetsp:Transcript_5999/g.6976  ORF Transcript_5999/g.6976 Transcript_5999/m.6976 type:complete len:163 (+) Transcript_5999:20-508(+)